MKSPMIPLLVALSSPMSLEYDTPELLPPRRLKNFGPFTADITMQQESVDKLTALFAQLTEKTHELFQSMLLQRIKSANEEGFEIDPAVIFARDQEGNYTQATVRQLWEQFTISSDKESAARSKRARRAARNLKHANHDPSNEGNQ